MGASDPIAAPPATSQEFRPATERILARLPKPRMLWIVAWAAVPWLNAVANLGLDAGDRSAIWEQRNLVIVLNYAAVSFAILVTLLGAERIARRVDRLDETMSEVLAGVSPSGSFRELNAFLGPLLCAAATAFAFGVSALIQDGWVAGLLRGTTWFIIGVPIWSFLWTYASLQVGLIRLGRSDLRDEASLTDPSLRLRPLGAIAFMALSLLLASVVPVLVTGLPDVVGLVLGLLVLGGGIAAFVFSLWGLHRQIVAVKEDQLALARELYAQAYEPLRAERTLDSLERQHSLLGAADALEKRARAIHDWPVAEGTWAWVIGIATSVVAITCARLILRPLGF